MGARRGLDIRPDDVVVGAGAKPFIAYTIASVTDYGAGDEVIYPVPGFPIYESQIHANGAVPVPIFLRESRDFAFDPAELEAKITPQTKLLILNTPHNPTGGMLQAADLDTIAEILSRHPHVWVFADEIYSRLAYAGAFETLATPPGDARADDHLRRRVEDLGDDRLAHRLRRQSHPRAGVHALDHEHRFLRVADLAMGGGRGRARTAERRRGDARELSRAPRPHRRPAEHGARRYLQDPRWRVLRVAECHRGLPHHRMRRLGSLPQASADRRRAWRCSPTFTSAGACPATASTSASATRRHPTRFATASSASTPSFAAI